MHVHPISVTSCCGEIVWRACIDGNKPCHSCGNVDKNIRLYFMLIRFIEHLEHDSQCYDTPRTSTVTVTAIVMP